MFCGKWQGGKQRLLGVTSVLNLTGDPVNDLTRVWGRKGRWRTPGWGGGEETGSTLFFGACIIDCAFEQNPLFSAELTHPSFPFVPLELLHPRQISVLLVRTLVG